MGEEHRATCNALYMCFQNYIHGLPHTAGSSRQEAWLETVTSGMPFGLLRVACRRMPRFFTCIFWPPPMYSIMCIKVHVCIYVCVHSERERERGYK